MIQKTKLVWIAIIYTLIFSSRTAFSQTLPAVGEKGFEADSISGTPVDDIISAVNDGGLSAVQNMEEIKNIGKDEEEEIPALPGQDQVLAEEPAAFTPDSLKDLEVQGGLSTKAEIDAETPTVFKLAVRFLERVVFRNDVEFAERPTFEKGMDIFGTPTFSKDTAGYAVIKKGSQSVVIDFDKEYGSPPVVTAALSLQQYDDPEVRAAAEDLLLVSDVKYIVTKISKKGFEIMMDRKADSNIPFSWHALAVEKPKTFKKKGETLKGADYYSDLETDASSSNFTNGSESDSLPDQFPGEASAAGGNSAN